MAEDNVKDCNDCIEFATKYGGRYITLHNDKCEYRVIGYYKQNTIQYVVMETDLGIGSSQSIFGDHLYLTTEPIFPGNDRMVS